jgi:serine/threonine protein kinase/Tfp pilus assembly protein PilF
MTSLQTRQFGNYLILDQLAVGGMSELFRSLVTGNQGCGKLIALKKILHHLSNDEDLIGSFLEEAKLAALLNHPNIVQIYDYGQLEGACFIAMEYLSGKDCRSLLRNSQEKQIPFDRKNAIFIVSEVCAGLDYAHKLKDSRGKNLNIIHRDVSPQNILITYEGNVKIVDFGIAKSASRNIHAHKVIAKNKLASMSPEQARGKTIDHRSDIFSCGILLYELITGNHMLSRDTMQISVKIKNIVWAEEVAQGEKIQKVLERALQINPDDRYQTCHDMLNDLEECMQAETRPSPDGLSKYMKVLFAEEIASEKQYLQEIIKKGYIQVRGKASAAFMKPAVNLSNMFHEIKNIVRQTMKGLSQNVKTRKLVLAGSVGIFLVILLMTSINQRNAVSDQHQFTAKSEPDTFAESAKTAKFQKGMEALINRQFNQAIALFEEVLTLDPEMKDQVSLPYAEALAGLANNIHETDPEQAISLFKKALQFDPNRAQAYFQLGMIFLKQKNYAAAVENYEKVIEINPQLPDAFFNLGFINAMLKDYVKAEEMYNRVVELSPSYLDEALFNLALIQRKLGKDDESLANIKKALQINPKNELAQNYLRKRQGASKK